MIPNLIDPTAENHYFMMDERAGHHLVFVSQELAKQNPFHPHWVGTCGNAAALQAMARWTAVRRDQWQEWGAMAERIGQSAFAAHMHALLEADPLEQVEGALIQRQTDPTRIGVGQVVNGRDGMRMDILHIHAFNSIEACDAFHAWLMSKGNHELAARLVAIAYREGTDELSAALDEIAAERLAMPKSQPRGRRRGGGRRSAATSKGNGGRSHRLQEGDVQA